MSDLRIKLKIIYPPFLLIFTSVLALMVSVKWFFEVKHRLMLFHHFAFDVATPALLSIVLIIVVLRKRFHILDIKNKYGKQDHSLLAIIAIVCIVVPLNFALNYVGAAGYGLIHVKSVDEIHLHVKHSRYYAIDKFRLDTTMPYVDFDRYTSGKHHNTLNFSCVFVFPVLAEYDSANKDVVWYGMHFKENMSNHEDRWVKDSVERVFMDKCNAYIANATAEMGTPLYFENLPDNRDRAALTHIVPLIPDDAYEDVLMLQPRYDSFAERADKDGVRFLIALFCSFLLFFLAISFSPIHSENLEMYLKNELPDKDEFEEAITRIRNNRLGAILSLMLLSAIAVLLVIWLC